MATNTTQISCSISQQLFDQVSALTSTELRDAVTHYLHTPQDQAPQSPLTKEMLIKLRDKKINPRRNRQVGINVLKPTKEEIKTRAEQDGVTMAAIVRRAIYEYTKPNHTEESDTNLTAMYDAWGG